MADQQLLVRRILEIDGNVAAVAQVAGEKPCLVDYVGQVVLVPGSPSDALQVRSSQGNELVELGVIRRQMPPFSAFLTRDTYLYRAISSAYTGLISDQLGLL